MKNIFNRLAAAWRNRKADGIKVGDTVEIIDTRGHQFEAGSKVTVIGMSDPYYKVKGRVFGIHGATQYVKSHQIKISRQPLNKLAVFASAVIFVTALIIAFMPSNSAADMGKAIACAAGLIGLGAVAYIFIYDPSTDRFCDAIDNANSLTENEDEWLGL